MAGVPCTYVMHLTDIKRTSGVPLLVNFCSATYIYKIASLYLALWKISEQLELNSSKPLL
jgi:hypothetical protein